MCLPPFYVGLLHAADGLPARPDYPARADRHAYAVGYTAGRSPSDPTRRAHRTPREGHPPR